MRHLWLPVFVASVLVTYAVFFTGDIVSGDNLVQYYQTVQMADRHRGTFSAQEVAEILRTHDWGVNTRFGVNRDQSTYTTIYGVGQSMMALPLFAAARFAKGALRLTRPSDTTLWCLNWLVFAVLAVLLVRQLCHLAGLTGAWTTLITLAAAFGSPVWMYSSTPYNVVGEMLVVLAAIDLCLWLDADRGARPGAAGLAAAGLAALLIFGVTVRVFLVSAIPAFVGWFLSSQWRSAAPTADKRRIVSAFAVVFLAGVAALAAFNTYLFGSPMTSAYHDLGGVLNFGGAWTIGISGTMLSPLKSPLYFFPLAILLPAALVVLLWRRDRVGWFVVVFLVPQVYLLPKYSMWDGGPDLFVRFWLTLVPLVFLSLAAMVPHLSRRAWLNTAFFAVTVVLTALGGRAQVLTVMTDEREVYADVADRLGARQAAGREFEYHESVADLVAGQTVVSRAQAVAMGAPRRFLWFRNVPVPRTRLWVALVGVLASGWSLMALEARCRASS